MEPFHQDARGEGRCATAQVHNGCSQQHRCALHSTLHPAARQHSNCPIRSDEETAGIFIQHSNSLCSPFPLQTILNPSIHSGGDVDRLLDAFCRYQHEINPPSDADPRHWDHALLFSGYSFIVFRFVLQERRISRRLFRYDLYRDSQRTVAGYAPVKGMCSGWRSCTINEGLDFGSVFVTTHEIGHALGMYHDGATNECDASCCIMSPSVGNGKTKWSSCSVSEMTAFVTVSAFLVCPTIKIHTFIV